MTKYWVKSYSRSDGTRVKGHWVTTNGKKRRSRSRKSKRKSRKSKPWITRPGKLGGAGFLSKPSATQHRLLSKCVKEYGYRSCLGSVMVLNRNRSIKKKHGTKIDKLKDWLKNKYGKSL